MQVHPAFVQAMQEKKMCILKDGHDNTRVAEPYGIFITRQKEIMYCCYQVAGYSGTKLPGWRNFHIEDINTVTITSRSFKKRSDFNPDNKDLYYQWAEKI